MRNTHVKIRIRTLISIIIAFIITLTYIMVAYFTPHYIEHKCKDHCAICEVVKAMIESTGSKVESYVIVTYIAIVINIILIYNIDNQQDKTLLGLKVRLDN